MVSTLFGCIWRDAGLHVCRLAIKMEYTPMGLQRKLHNNSKLCICVSFCKIKTNTKRICAIINLWLSLTSIKYHLHHDYQWLDAISLHWLHQLLTVGLDEYNKLPKNLGKQLTELCVLSEFLLCFWKLLKGSFMIFG